MRVADRKCLVAKCVLISGVARSQMVQGHMQYGHTVFLKTRGLLVKRRLVWGHVLQ